MTNTLSVKNAQSTDAADYRCKITVLPGDVTYFSDKASLTVNTAAEITKDPASITVKVGDAITLTVMVDNHKDAHTQLCNGSKTAKKSAEPIAAATK